MNGKNICVVLCHPDESRNIGSVCRAMANSDVFDLRIVGKKEDYDDEQVRTLAHAEPALSIWNDSCFYEDLRAATSDCVIAAGTTRRRGKKRKDFLMLPEEFARHISKLSFDENSASESVKVANGTKGAVVFGNERTGLTDDELEVCNLGINIPSSNDFGSLNLSHAVQVILYTLFREFSSQSGKNVSGYTPVPLSRLDKTVDTIADSLQEIGFFKVAGRPDMEKFWRGILSRAAISEGEAQYIEKTFTKAAGLSGKIKP